LFSLRRHLQTGTRAHSASYPMGTVGLLPVLKQGGGMKLTTQLYLVSK